MRGTNKNARDPNRESHGNAIGALQDIIAERARNSLLVVTPAIDRSVGDHRAPVQGVQQERAEILAGSAEPNAGTAMVDAHTGELATANGRKDAFLAMLGHELRAPLGSIQNALRMLRGPAGETLLRQKAQALIERQVRRMMHLVDDLLDVSRISRGHLHIQQERIDLRVVLGNAIETVEADIKERSHRLTTELPHGPVWLQADPWRLEQVFVNLLANASRYTEPGGELAVWLHTRDDQVIVRIRDSGIGIAPHALPHIFDLFKQADETAPQSKSGLGIGLALARNLLELHGGSVAAASAGIGRGSEFTVRLPRQD